MAERYLKQVIVVRKDLTMPAGKLAAMAAHAAMTFILSKLVVTNQTIEGDGAVTVHEFDLAVSPEQARWLTELDPGIEGTGQVSMAKIVVAVSNLSELLDVEKRAKAAGLTVHRVIDSGYAHNKAGDFVCIAIGPDWPEKLDPVTSLLKVYR